MKILSFFLLLFAGNSIAQVVANLPDDIRICDENNPGDGTEVFDLTIREDQVLGGQTGLNVTYHLTSGGALSGINAFANPQMYTNIANPQLIFIRVQGNGGWDVTSMDIEAVQIPEADTLPEDIFIDEGDGNGQAIFDLTVNESAMLGSQFPSGFVFSYYLTQPDCDAGTNPIATPAMFTNFENPQEIYVRMQSALAECFTCYNYRIMSDGTLSIGQNDLQTITLYPNPVVRMLTVDASQILKDASLIIYNVKGQLITSEILRVGDIATQVNLDGLTSGVYFVKLVSEKNQITQQIIKE